MTAPATTYTEESRRLFLRSVANKVDEVADAASIGPWLLSQTINDAIQVAPAPDNTERHLCGLIDPNDARAAVAADPANLRSLAYVMREAATNPATPPLIIDGLCDVAQRWDTAMLLRCSGVLHVAPPAPTPPAAVPADPDPAPPTPAPATVPAPVAAVPASDPTPTADPVLVDPIETPAPASPPAPAPEPAVTVEPAAPAAPETAPAPAATRAPARKSAGARKKPVPVAAPAEGTGPAAAPTKTARKATKAAAPARQSPAAAAPVPSPVVADAADDVWG